MWLEILKACVPILVAIVGIVPTVISSASKTRAKLDDVEKKLDSHIRENEWDSAKQTRIRILRFNDEICEGKNHSENHYEEVLDDIDIYEKFCETHKDYHNNKGQLAMKNIKREYEARKTKQSFLKEKKE